jgi:hypothetical protein
MAVIQSLKLDECQGWFSPSRSMGLQQPTSNESTLVVAAMMLRLRSISRALIQTSIVGFSPAPQESKPGKNILEHWAANCAL